MLGTQASEAQYQGVCTHEVQVAGAPVAVALSWSCTSELRGHVTAPALL